MGGRDLPSIERLRALLPRGGQLPDRVWQARHRAITGLLWLHVLALPPIGLLLGRDVEQTAVDVALVSVFALAASMRGVQRWARASLSTLGLVATSATLVHFYGGLIELHFHFFVVIAVISLYQSWAPYLLAVGFVLLHHGVLGTLAPSVVYNHAGATDSPYLFALIHGGFVLAESIACLAYWRTSEHALAAERRERAEAQHANAALAKANSEISDLVAMLSHDLRTPLTVVNGFVAILRQQWPAMSDARREDLLKRIDAAGFSLQSMLDDALSVSAIEADGLRPEPQAVRLDEAVRDVLQVLAEPLPGPDLSGLSPVVALVDPGHLHQVLSNLITNARKYGAAPYVFTCDGVGDRVRVTLTDGGEGVPDDFTQRLFERFARADLHRRGDHKGTGLGLYIARRLALANGGELHHQRPTDGRGAAFTVSLPTAARRVPAPPDRLAPVLQNLT